MSPETQFRVIQFLLSHNDQAAFIARHVQQRGYVDPGISRLEVGLRERVAYIVMSGSEPNAPAKRWSIESDARKQRIEANEAALLAQAFEALPLAAWRALIDACANGPDAAYALGLGWQRRPSDTAPAAVPALAPTAAR